MYCNKTAAEVSNASILLKNAYSRAQEQAKKCLNGMNFSVPASTNTAAAPSAAEAVEKLESSLSRQLNIPHVCATGGGRAAGLLALRTLSAPILGERSLRRGDEVITVGLHANAICELTALGVTPVLADVMLPQYNIDVRELERALSPNTRAVMLSHTLGYPFNLKTVRNFCNDYELWLIEDSREAMGAAYDFDGTRYAVGTVGDIGIGSTASLSPDGQGCGALYTRDDTLSAIAREILAGDADLSPDAEQAATDVTRLKTLTDAEGHRHAAAWLIQALRSSVGFLTLPEALPEAHPAPWALPLTCGEDVDTGALMEALRQRGVPFRALLAAEDAEQLASLAARGCCRPIGDLPVTRRILADTLVIPLPLGITEETLASAVKAVEEALS